MGVIDDIRKVIQDLVAPELKSLQVQLKGLEEASKLRDDALSEKIDRKFEIVLAKMEANQASIIYALNIEKRVEAIERKTATPMQAT